VYEAEEIQSGRRVALKVLKQSPDSPASRQRFLREGRLAASVNHPNSIYVFGTEEINGRQVIAMELAAGGTLQDHVKRRGPLPITEAVDTILQVVAGLEAAAAVGVLHRDLKPSNCFVESDGTVKIGDFGLSIAQAAAEETDLTMTGSFLGTPAFSSPEQLRGDRLTIQSDIYAVGVTFYYLLTGRTPFASHNLVRQLALMLERPAETPAKWRPEIPKPLCNIVLRCLEKEPAGRFANYHELRQSLLPYSSTVPSSAPLPYTGTPTAASLLRLRFLAGFLDFGLLCAVSILFRIGATAVSPDFWKHYTAPREYPGFHTILVIAFTLLSLVYFGVAEGLWGASVGKLTCRLRVVNFPQGSPGVLRSCWRVGILCFFGLPISLSVWFQLRQAPASDSKWQLIESLELIVFMFPFVTARRRNGLAAIHDLLTSTRVVHRSVTYREQKQTHDLWAPSQADHTFVSSRPDLQIREEKQVPSLSPDKIGPYEVMKLLEKNETNELLLAYDARLQRKVWIRRFVSIGAPQKPPRFGVSGQGGLRWLTRKRSDDECWDAYEALTGKPLLDLIGARQPWSTLRSWLLDLAEELSAYLTQSTMPLVLALDRVWITDDGRAKLLDFPAPGVAAGQDSHPHASTDQALGSSEQRDPAHFLARVAVVALGGRAVQSNNNLAPLSAPIPKHARKLLMALEAGLAPHLLEERLKFLLDLHSTVSRWRRLGVVAGCSLFLIWPLLFFTAVIPARKVIPLARCLDALTTLTYAGGLDGLGSAYSATLLGTSPTWDGVRFSFGPPNAANAVKSVGQTIILPQKRCSSLRLLATDVGARELPQSFMVTYTDNTSSNYNQRFSNYCIPRDNSGESRAVTMVYRNISDGSHISENCYLYGYSFHLDPRKKLKSLTLPSDGDVVLLAITAGTPGTQVELSSAFNVTNGIVRDGSVFTLDKRSRDAFEIYIAGQFRRAITNPATFNLPLSMWRIPLISRDEETLAKQALAAHLSIAPAELDEVTPIVQSYLAQAGSRRTLTLAEWWASPRMFLHASAFYFLVMTAVPALIATFLFRRGAVLRLAALCVVKRDGSPASRLRLLWRSLLVCLPGLALFVSGSFWDSEPPVYYISIGCALLTLCYVLLPERSLHDRLAGTSLVPH
jgi:hypothetical protein